MEMLRTNKLLSRCPWLWKPLGLALVIAVYGVLAVVFTRGGKAEDMLWGPYGIFPLSSLIISSLGVFTLRLFGHQPGGYASPSEIFVLAGINVLVYGSLFGTWSYWRYRRQLVAQKAQPSNTEALMQDQSACLGRRRFLICGCSALALMRGSWCYLRRDVGNLQVEHHRLTLADLPPSLVGLKLALIADLHRGPYVDEQYLVCAIELINSLKPDIVCVAGDFVYISPRYFSDIASELSHCHPAVALMGVLGNHDHWQGADLAREQLGKIGLQWLDNTRLFVDEQRRVTSQAPARGLCLAGLGDYWEDKCDYSQALADVPQSMPRIVLAHNPDAAQIAEAGEHRVDVMLAGHTHGGQVLLPLVGAVAVPVSSGERFIRGWAQGDYFPVYVNRGLGQTVMPIRSGSRPEITMFTLQAG